MVWVSSPKNAVERLASILVIERKSTSARYYCVKCNSTFFGSKKRIKEHLRGEGKDVKHCNVPLTPEEEATLREDDELDPGRGPRLQQVQDAEGGGIAPRKRKRVPMEQHVTDSDSPFPGDEPSPGEGWQKVSDPRDHSRTIWVAEPKNDIERLGAVLVVERRTTTCRYLCTKCHFMFWGSKKRVKEHLRDQAGDVKGCAVRITPEEEIELHKDDIITRVRTPARARKAGSHEHHASEPLSKEEKTRKYDRPLKRVRRAASPSRRARAESISPFPASDPPPEEEGWSKGRAPDGAEIWLSDPKNSVERLPAVMVIERRATAARYMCAKCHLMFWGSKKRIKEHLRRQGTSVTGCTHEPTYEEEGVMRADDPDGEGDGRYESPYLANTPAPSDDGSWTKALLPDGREAWVAQVCARGGVWGVGYRVWGCFRMGERRG